MMEKTTMLKVKKVKYEGLYLIKVLMHRLKDRYYAFEGIVLPKLGLHKSEFLH